MQILVRVLVLATSVLSLIGCGQPGGLYLPTEPAAAQRATLPQTLMPVNPFGATPPLKPGTPSTSATSPTPASAPTTP